MIDYRLAVEVYQLAVTFIAMIIHLPQVKWVVLGKLLDIDPRAPVYIDENGITTAVIPGVRVNNGQYRISLANQTVTFTYTPKDIVSNPWDGLYVYKRTA